MKRILLVLPWIATSFLLGGLGSLNAHAQEGTAFSTRVVDDFERYEVNSIPNRWLRVNSRNDVRPAEDALKSGERFEVLEEDGNQFVRLYTNGEYIRFSLRNGKEFDWNLNTYPRLRWQWRALTLPEGASEKGKNDTGGAVYVTFGKDWLGRPKSIKYTYSSSLPTGTVVSFGPLKVIVADSKQEPRMGECKTETRHVINDYRQVFGGDPPDRPVSITISGDSDTTGDESKVDIDDITLLPARSRK
jgi:hypothetical protein